jgi:uncharacterized protein YndB with AHSA1/START domain
MEHDILSNFIIDKEDNRILVEVTFSAPTETVWNAWTQREWLDQWWAPKPWKAITKTMDFKEGGYWLYYMEGPNGERTWSKADFKNIDILKGFKAIDTFCDENGLSNPELPKLYWRLSFTPMAKKTKVEVEVRFGTLSDLEKIIEMGFKEGFIAALDNLEERL